MSALHIIVGYKESHHQSKPELVYLGSSGSEAQAAAERSPFPRHELFKSVRGIRKNNPHAARNAAQRHPEQASSASASNGSPVTAAPAASPSPQPPAADGPRHSAPRDGGRGLARK